MPGRRLSTAIAAALLAAALGTGAPSVARARPVTVVVIPASPSPGTLVRVYARGLPPGRGVVASLRALAMRRTRSDALGRATVSLRLPSHARTGPRVLVVRAGSRRIAVSLGIVSRAGSTAALVGIERGGRLVVGSTRERPGATLRLTGSRLGARVRASVTLGGRQVGAARADRRRRLRLSAIVPPLPAGTHTLIVRLAGVRARVPFAVLATGAAAPPVTAAGQPDAMTVVAAGDIACSPADAGFNGGAGTPLQCRQAATAGVIAALAPSAVLALGDTQYPAAALSDYAQSYAPTWGRFDAIVHPVPGDHEYLTPGASGYFAYFGAAAGDPARGYDSFDVGAWHVVALNSNCPQVSCATGSAQERWLRADLAAHPAACTLAFWHDPRFSSGQAGQATGTDPLWRALQDAGAELVLSGHSHTYERFAPQTLDRLPDPRGIREFVVGTGGEEHQPFATVRPNSEVRDATTFGVLALTLRPSGYDWRFVPEPGGLFTDAGSATCH